MTKKEFYKKLIGEKWFNKETIIDLLRDIGEANSGGCDEIRFDEDGIEVESEVYVPCGRGCCGDWETKIERTSWEELVNEFFDEIERNHEWEKKQSGVAQSAER